MAGTIIADYIRTDANKLSLNVGNTTFATINAMGLLSNTGVQIITQNGTINAASIAAGTIGTTQVANAAITNAKLSLSANDSNIKTALNASGDAGIFACRAWVNFNGTGTVAIRGSGNVSSITDNGTGEYTVNFTTAMPDTNYAVVAGCMYVAGSGFLRTLQRISQTAPTTSAIQVIAYEENAGAVDPTYCDVAIFR